MTWNEKFEKWWTENCAADFASNSEVKRIAREAFELGAEAGWESHADSVQACEGP
jgi:hypothetical protein